MTRAEREQLIERYLRGQMSPSEEHDFFIEVAGNKELRLDLKAYRIVDDALRKDRSAETATYSALRASMLTMIESRGTMPPVRQKAQMPPSGPAEMIGTTPAVPAAPDAGTGRWAVWLAIGVVLLMIAGGLFLRRPSAVRSPAAPPVAPSAVSASAPSGSAPAGHDAVTTFPAATVDSSAMRIDTTVGTGLQGVSEAPAASVAARPARGSVRAAHDRGPRRNDSAGSIRGGVRAGKNDSLKIQLIIQDPKKK
jgi:hypothetical protein